MPEWIQLDPTTLNRNRHHDIAGVEIVVGLSPYDLPEKVRGFYDNAIRRFVIEFSYLGDEDEKRERIVQNKHLALLVGEHSGRLHGIQIDVDDLKAKHVALKVPMPDLDEAFKKLTNQRRFRNKRSHYQVAKDVVRLTEDELFSGAK